MARKDEVRVSENFAKYMKFINSYEEGKYTAYEFEDESGNIGIHYQIKPELLTDKRQIGLARLFNTKMGKIKVGDICLVICKCREVHEAEYNQSAMYLNIDKVLKPLTKTKLVVKDYRGMPTEFAIEEPITEWNELSRIN
jgi:hypothetical protein